MQYVYIVTNSGDLTGAIGNPIIQYHTADGLAYSDFMEIRYVTAPQGYSANKFKSVGDVMSSGANMTDSGIVINLPVVPTNATLQDPETVGNNKAPISPTLVWYKGVEVWTYVFEVTDVAAATYFASTRTNPLDAAYNITVTKFASSTAVTSIPLWFFNPYSRGVTPGLNNGGPNPKGMKNILNLDRTDAGYSPLWNLYWLTELPINYSADDISNSNAIDTNQGFKTFVTPMFVNCPDIGKVGTTKNVAKTTFETTIDASKDSNFILGSPPAFILKPGVEIKVLASNNAVVAMTTTSPAGSYQVEVPSCKIPKAGATDIGVTANGTVVQNFTVVNTPNGKCNNGTSSAGTRLGGVIVAIGSMVLVALL
jgi:hypothetical protein